MSVLRSLESKIAGLVEGAFSRAFRSEVRPVEIARKLSREMEEHRTVSVSRTYVPNEYIVYLSPEDRARFADYEQALMRELEAYLLEYSRRERVALLSRPSVEFETDEQLGLGEFGIQARLVRAAADASAELEQGETGRTMIYRAEHLREQAPFAPARARDALLLLDGRRIVVGRSGLTLGRSRECDVVVDDSSVSRHHAEIRPTEEGWTLIDLGSTNGTRVDGRQIERRHTLRGGERIELGTKLLTFESE